MDIELLRRLDAAVLQDRDPHRPDRLAGREDQSVGVEMRVVNVSRRGAAGGGRVVRGVLRAAEVEAACLPELFAGF